MAIKRKLIGALKILLPIGLGIYLVVHIYGQLGDEQRKSLFTAMREANYFWVALSFGMGLLSHYIRGYRWRFQLESMGYHIGASNGFFAVMIGYITNMVLPRVGEVSRAATITRYEQVPFQKSFGTILSERAVDFVVLLAITIATMVLQYGLLYPFAQKMLAQLSGTFTSVVLWTTLAVVGLAAFILLRLLDRFRDIPFFHKIWELKEGLMEGLRSILRMERRVSYLWATAAIWLLYIGMFWVCFLAIPETEGLGPDAVFAGFVIGSFAIVIIPGGIGAFPAGIMQVLLLYGVAAEKGFALGWILWLSQTSMIVLAGGLSLILIPIFNRKKTRHVENGSA